MGFYFFLALIASILVYKWTAVPRKKNTEEGPSFFPEEKHSTLLKEATANKKENISQAVKLIREANEILKDYPISYRRQGITKLADYERINGNPKETISVLFEAYKEAIYSDEYFMRAMEASIFISYIVTQTKKMKIESAGLEIESDKLQIVALAVQGRMGSITTRVPQSESNIELKEFLDKNNKTLGFFNEKMPLADSSFWENNKRINEDFYSIINDVDNNIENKLTVVSNSIT